MKKGIYALLVLLVAVGGLVYANRESKNQTTAAPQQQLSAAAAKEAAIKEWETTPGGIAFLKWEASAAGKKVYASEAKIKEPLAAFTNMEAVVTSFTLPPGSRLGFGVMVKIDGEDYIVSFGSEEANEFQQLRSLKVADKIMLRSRAVSHAPKYAYPIIAGDYVERDGKLLYKSIPRKGGC